MKALQHRHVPNAVAVPTSGSNSLALSPTLDEIYEAHFDFVWRNARRLGIPADQADDVVQDVFVVVHRRIDDFAGGSVRPWILGILVRVVSDHRRSHRRKTGRWVPLEPELIADRRDPVALVESAERMRLVEALLAELEEPQRLLLVLADLEQWKLREIADFFDTNINTIYSRLRAARRAFEEAYTRVVGADGEAP